MYLSFAAKIIAYIKIDFIKTSRFYNAKGIPYKARFLL